MSRFLLLAMLFIWVGVLPADIVMNLEMSRSNYMLYEPVVAHLTMRNSSGQVLVFGSEAEFNGHMEIELTDMHDRPVKGSGAKVNLRGMILRPGVDHRIRVNLSKWIDLQKVGYYRIRVFIAHPMLKNEYQSNRCMFDISYGKVFWTRTFGVPKLAGSSLSENVQLRKYTLRGLQDKSEIFLFLFIEDDKLIYSFKHLGLMLGREKPSCELDTLNQLHILLPVTTKLFRYQVYDWNGELEVNKVYRTSDRAPLLFRDAQTGEVKIIGGEIAQEGLDYAEQKLLPGVPLETERRNAPAK